MEGPSLVILKEELKRFERKKVLNVSGNSKQPISKLQGRTLQKTVTWGKTIYLIFSGNIVTKTHFLLFGSYRIDEERPDRSPRVQLEFSNGIVYFYACAFSMDAKDSLDELDHRVDVLSDEWNESYVTKMLSTKENSYLCDLFVDQSLFSGSGNIVKNEVLFNIRRHPLTKLSDIDPKDRKKIVHAVREYCENFYKWKKKFELRKHWQVYKQITCKVCERKLKREKLGKGKRSTFYCPFCQNKKLTSSRITVHRVVPLQTRGSKEDRFDH